MTGVAYGMSANLSTFLFPVTLAPTPTTGEVANSRASTTAPPCGSDAGVLLIRATNLCKRVTTATMPGTATAESTVSNVSIAGILGLPVIEATEVKATSRTICGASSGGTTITSLVIGGRTTTVSGDANAGIDLPGLLGAKVVVNEQIAASGPGDDRVLTVNALHLMAHTWLGASVDIVVASATSDIHNCP